MSRRRKAGGKSLEVIQRLQQRVSEGEYYEALQLYKTSYSRLKAQGKLDDAEELLVTGAIAMSKENEVYYRSYHRVEKRKLHPGVEKARRAPVTGLTDVVARRCTSGSGRVCRRESGL